MAITIDLNLRTLTVAGAYNALAASPTATHIHCCAPAGTSSVVAVPFPQFPSTTAGTYNNTFDMTLASSYTASFLTNSGGTACERTYILCVTAAQVVRGNRTEISDEGADFG